MPKFGDYPASTAPNNGDLILIKDVVANSTKKITRSNLLVGTTLPTNTVTTAAITNASVTNAKLATGAGEPGGAWTSYTTTPTAGSFGTGGSSTGKYTRIGNTILFSIEGTVGSSGWSMNLTLPLPVASSTSTTITPVGNVVFLDAGSSAYAGYCVLASTTTITLRIMVSGTNARLDISSNSNPFSWGNGDKILINGSYEAA